MRKEETSYTVLPEVAPQLGARSTKKTTTNKTSDDESATSRR